MSTSVAVGLFTIMASWIALKLSAPYSEGASPRDPAWNPDCGNGAERLAVFRDEMYRILPHNADAKSMQQNCYLLMQKASRSAGISQGPSDFKEGMLRRSRIAFRVTVLASTLLIFWIACVGSFHIHELEIGIPAILIALIFCLFTVRKLPLSFQPSAAELAQVWRLPWDVVRDIIQIVSVLVHDLAGKPAPWLFRAVGWRDNAETGQGTARRALATAYATVSPNFIMVGIDRELGQMLFHQLHASEVPQLAQRLGAGDAG